MFFATMRHYYWKDGKGIIVQNVVGGYLGQEHRHSQESFARWIKENNIDPDNLIDVDKLEGRR